LIDAEVGSVLRRHERSSQVSADDALNEALAVLLGVPLITAVGKAQ